MLLPSRESKPVVWLVLYWASQWALIVLLVLLATTTEPPAGDAMAYWIAIAFVLGWVAMVPVWAASYLALAHDVWWRRPMIAISLGLTLDLLVLLGRDPERGREYDGDFSLLHWLPFLSAAVVWCVMACSGRWQMERNGELIQPAKLALRDLFVWTAIVAAGIWPMQSMVVAILRNSTQMLDKLLIALVAIAALFFVPPITMIAASLIRIRLGEGRPSRAIWTSLLLPSVGLLGWGLYIWIGNSPGDLASVYGCIAFTIGAVLHTLVFGQLLRRLGYRIQSRSWWARS